MSKWGSVSQLKRQCAVRYCSLLTIGTSCGLPYGWRCIWTNQSVRMHFSWQLLGPKWTLGWLLQRFRFPHWLSEVLDFFDRPEFSSAKATGQLGT
jgi:hypothetical protein